MLNFGPFLETQIARRRNPWSISHSNRENHCRDAQFSGNFSIIDRQASGQ